MAISVCNVGYVTILSSSTWKAQRRTVMHCLEYEENLYLRQFIRVSDFAKYKEFHFDSDTTPGLCIASFQNSIVSSFLLFLSVFLSCFKIRTRVVSHVFYFWHLIFLSSQVPLYLSSWFCFSYKDMALQSNIAYFTYSSTPFAEDLGCSTGGPRSFGLCLRKLQIKYVNVPLAVSKRLSRLHETPLLFQKCD